MEFESWRGTIGSISPVGRPSTEDKTHLVPEGIHNIQMYVDAPSGGGKTFSQALVAYEERARALAALGVDYVHPTGAQPFIAEGFRREQEIIAEWENRYGVAMFTSGMAYVEAIQALGLTRIVGASYFRDDLNQIFARYFTQAGVGVLTMEGIGIDPRCAHQLNSREVYGFVRRLFLAHRDGDGIYLLGGAWPTLDILDMLEQDMGVPVIQADCARSWALQERLHVHQRLAGFGSLLRELPEPVLRLGSRPVLIASPVIAEIPPGGVRGADATSAVGRPAADLWGLVRQGDSLYALELAIGSSPPSRPRALFL